MSPNINGYFCCKTITPQNVLSEAQLKNFFISCKNYVRFSGYSSFYIFNQSFRDIANMWRHDEYQYMRQDTFWNIYFESQLINPPNLVN